MWWLEQTNGCVGYERLCLHGDKKVFQLLLDEVAKECRPEGRSWQIKRQVSPTQSHKSSGVAEKAISSLRGLARTYLAVIKERIPSFDVKPDSPMLPWTIRHAAWFLTRHDVRRDTRMTPYEKIRRQRYKKDVLPLGEQVLARRLGANVNQLLQPWFTGLWLSGRDSLNHEHLVCTSARVMSSRAVRRLHEPALYAVLFGLRAPHLVALVHRDRHTRSLSMLERCQNSK